MKQLSEIFGDNLRFFRKKAGMTQAEVGAKLGCTEKAVSKWESGGAIPRPEYLVALSNLFKISIDVMLENRRDVCYYVGIDGGGTKTLMALADNSGKVLRTICTTASNPMTVGIEKAVDTLTEAVRELCDGILLSQISLFAGIAGVTEKSFAQLIKKTFLDMRFARVLVGNDSENIVSAGLSGRNGMSLIMGTGSNLFTQKNGLLRQYGGCGYLFDNGGNGYSVARDAIHSVLYEENGIGEKTLLTEIFHAKYHCTAHEMLPAFYRKGNKFVASFSDFVYEGFQRGDETARTIFYRNMVEVAKLIDAGLKDFPDTNEVIPVVAVGGLTAYKDVLFPMILKEMRHADRIKLTAYPYEPVLGALRLAGARVNTESDNGITRGESV